MERIPEMVTPKQDQQKSGHQSLQPTHRPAWADVDLDPLCRPGVARTRMPPHPFPNTRFPPERQRGEPAAPMHGRRDKPLPPVFGTSTPLHGLSGLIRRAAARYPDHKPQYWFIKMLADRVEAWGVRGRRVLPWALPFVAAGVAGGHFLRRRLTPAFMRQEQRSDGRSAALPPSAHASQVPRSQPG